VGALAEIDRSGRFAPAPDSTEERVLDALLDCIGRWGIAKTTAEDIARAAGISRATLYRTFPGGKDVVVDALVRHETARFFRVVSARLDRAATVDDVVTIGIVEAARFLADHRALGYLLRHEPDRVLPAFAFHRLDRVLAIATDFAAPHLRRFLADDHTAAVRAEWVVRVLLSYVVNPSPELDLTDEADVRRFVATYLVPVLVTHPDPNPAANAPKER